jgi:hypothetical protein
MVVVEPFKRLCNFGLRRKNLEGWNSNVNLILKRDFINVYPRARCHPIQN